MIIASYYDALKRISHILYIFSNQHSYINCKKMLVILLSNKNREFELIKTTLNSLKLIILIRLMKNHLDVIFDFKLIVFSPSLLN